MSKTLRNSILLVVVVLLGYLYLSPYIVLYQIKTAIENGDSAKISRYIDFDSLRHSLKQQIGNIAQHYFAKNHLDHRLLDTLNLTQLQADSELNQLLDQAVSPAGIQTLLEIKQQQAVAKANHPSASASSALKFSEDYSTAYQSLNWFNVKLNHQKFQQHALQLKMQRDGLSWKIKAVELIAKQ